MGSAEPDAAADAAPGARMSQGAALRVAVWLGVVVLSAPVVAKLAQLWWALARPLPLFVLAAAAAVALWRCRSRTDTLAWAPPLAPWLWFAAGLALVWVGARSGAWRLAGYGLPPLWLGGLGLVRGERAVRRLWPVAALLLFAVPHPNAPTYQAIAAGKSLVGHAAASVLTLCGIPTALDGWNLDVAGQQVRLVDACSGARTQAGLLAVVALLLCLRPASRASRVAMLLACVPAALVSSVLRVVIVGACYARPDLAWWGDRVHTVLEVGVIVPGVLLVLAAGRLVETFRRAAAAAQANPDAAQANLDAPPVTPGAPGAPASESARSRLAAATTGEPRSPLQHGLALALILAVVGALGLPRQAPSGRLPGLPAMLDGLAGQPAPDQAALRETLAGDQVQFHQYGGGAREHSTALLVHFQRLDAPYDLFSHAPQVCHSVFGWTVTAEDDVELGDHRVRRLEIAQGDARRVVHLAYLDAHGRSTPSLFGAWIRTVFDGALGRTTERTLLVLSSGDQPGVSPGLLRREGLRVQQLLDTLADGPAREL